MQIVRDLFETIAELLAADTATLAAVLANKLHLAKAAFTPGLDLTLAQLTEATFPGYAALSAGTGEQPTFYGASSGLYTIEILEPAGGWHWESTGAPSPAETIFGFYLTDNAGTVLLGAALLDTPVTISAINQGIDIGTVDLKFLAESPQ